MEIFKKFSLIYEHIMKKQLQNEIQNYSMRDKGLD